jgi:hypothetical protein
LTPSNRLPDFFLFALESALSRAYSLSTASRPEHQCRGGGVIVSEAVLADSEAREALKGRNVTEDSAMLRGLSEPVRFVRIGAGQAMAV